MGKNSVQAYLINRADEHSTEFIKDSKNDLLKLTNFSGSLGMGFVTMEDAYVYVDSRYFLSAAKELPEGFTMLKREIDVKSSEFDKFVLKHVKKDEKIGIYPYSFPHKAIKNLSNKLAKHSVEFKCIEQNLVSKVMESYESLDAGFNDIFHHDLASEGWCEKVEKILQKMEEKQAQVLVLTLLDDIAYLLNLRGSDADYTPLFYSYLTIVADPSESKPVLNLYVNKSKLPTDINEKISSNEKIGVEIHPYEQFSKDFAKLCEPKKLNIWASGMTTNYGIFSKIDSEKLIDSYSPVALLKAVKSDKEIENFKIANHEEAICFFKFMDWLEKNYDKMDLDELSASDYFEKIKNDHEPLDPSRKHVSLSFGTIFSVGANGADIHHNPSSDAKITGDELILMDFGSQYHYGTTDTTRTFHLKTPSKTEIDHFTLVLKGFIASATTILSTLHSLNYLEGASRRFLSQKYLDFRHGLGHGVGLFSCVHEFPPSTGYMGDDYDLRKVQPGLVFSNEPGVYLEGQFGVRIENVVYTKKIEDKEFVEIVDLTMIPIQKKMIDFSQLESYQKEYLSKMNSTIRNEFKDLHKREPAAYDWMMRNTDF